jgi:hypothetical protein
MSLDFSHSGEARLTMSGYLNEILMTLGVTGTARTPATDTLFEADGTELVTADVRVWFHRVVAQVLYLAKWTRPEILTTVSYLATRVPRCTESDVAKLHRLIRYLRDLGPWTCAQTREVGNRSEVICRCVIRGAH